jgi:hypothetical protein
MTAKDLERFITEEIKREIPLVVVSNSLLFYKDIKIKQLKSGNWCLFSKTGDKIAEFRMRSTASLAAKFYHKTDFKNYNWVKIIDFEYWHNYTDAEIFQYRKKNTKDFDRRDTFTARYEMAKSKADHYKQEITSLFKVNF